MADSKVSALTDASALTGAEKWHATQSGADRAISAEQMRAFSMPSIAATTATQSITANTDTYLTGSAINVAGRLKVGSVLRWRIVVSKTNAGTAQPVWNVRFGTNGTTADSSRLALTGSTQTAAIDVGVFEITVVVTAVGASGAVRGFVMLNHNLGATGLGGAGTNAAAQAASAAFDTTVANLKAGISVNSGASAVWTVQWVLAEAHNLI